MQAVDLPVDSIITPDWNPNQMNPVMRTRLERSLARFGNLGVLVVRPVGSGRYETVGGAQRLAVLRDMGHTEAPCVVVQVDDAEGRLLAQALNHVVGSDDFGKRAESLRRILESVPQEEVLSLLPETAESLQALSTLTPSSLADHMRNWEVNRSARLRHVTVQVTDEQLSVVEQALVHATGEMPSDDSNPNRRGNAFHHICRDYIAARAL